MVLKMMIYLGQDFFSYDLQIYLIIFYYLNFTWPDMAESYNNVQHRLPISVKKIYKSAEILAHATKHTWPGDWNHTSTMPSGQSSVCLHMLAITPDTFCNAYQIKKKAYGTDLVMNSDIIHTTNS